MVSKSRRIFEGSVVVVLILLSLYLINHFILSGSFSVTNVVVSLALTAAGQALYQRLRTGSAKKEE